MAAPATTDEFIDLIRKSGVAEEKRFDAWVSKTRPGGLPVKPTEVAGLLVRDGVLTTFQAEQILQGKWKRFTIGKYKVLERLGSGGMGSVYLCEHKLMRRRVAVKVLPSAKAQDESALQRFYREARAVAALDHPNIVHAYDIDKDESLHFLVMEYVDGASLQEVVKKAGPMDIGRAAHYIRQAALGLDHAHQAGLIHRDIKPANILIDRTGLIKILDMGLARFFNDEDDILTKKFDENVLGTADYLAPEQAIDSHTVDIRADIYSLGTTFYFMLTGRTPFGEGTVAQKLLWHQNRQPKPVTEFRPEVPAGLAAVILKMMDKEPANRYQTPADVAVALEPYTQAPIGAPPDAEMPHLSPAALAQSNSSGGAENTDTAVVKGTAPAPTAVPRALQGMSSKSMATGPAKAPTPAPAPPRTAPAPARVAATSAPSSPAAKPAPTPAPASLRPAAQSAPAVQTVAAAQAGAAAQAVVTAPEPAPVADDEEAPWESLSSMDTEDPSAKGDTAPQGGRSARRLARSAAVKNSRRAWMIFIVIGIGALVIVAGFLVSAFMNQTGPSVSSRGPLDVSKDSTRPNSYRTILQALRAAQSGDVIQLSDPEHYENLSLESRMKTEIALDVTIQVAPGKEVVWKPLSKDETRPLLLLQHARNFKIKGKGLTFDGAIDEKKRVKDLVVINFEAPGLAIEDATFKGFGRSAINVVNAGGSKEKPIRLVRLTALATSSEQPVAGLVFDANPDVQPYFNDYFEISDFRVDGLKEDIKKSNTVVGKNISWPK